MPWSICKSVDAFPQLPDFLGVCFFWWLDEDCLVSWCTLTKGSLDVNGL